MEWIKKNGALALGIGLPVLLVLFFILAAQIPRWFGNPPQYDVLYIAPYNGYEPDILRFEVRNQHISFSFVGENYTREAPRIIRYSPSQGTMKEIMVHVPDNLQDKAYSSDPAIPFLKQSPKITPVSVPELEQVKVDPSRIAPDGFEFRTDYRRSSGVMGELFFSSRYYSTPVLAKDGYILKIPYTDRNEYYANVRFIGWVIP